MRSPHFFAILALTSCVTNVMAGPGANVYACIDLPIKPLNSFTVSFDPNSGSNKCMVEGNTGSQTTVTVTDSGLTCGSIGYVEAKVTSSGGDLCATDQSIWNIVYSTSDLPKKQSGSIKSRWRKQWLSQTNEISFQEPYPTGAMVCGSQALCCSSEFTWDSGSAGPAYFIFQPDKQANLEMNLDYSDQIVLQSE